MNKRQLIAGALSTALLVSAVPGLALAQDDAATPEAVEWTLTSLAGEPVPEGVETTLLLSGGEVVGNAGCNSYSGSYELEGESLTFPNPFAVTAMFCEGAPMEVEDAYLPLLQATAGWAIADSELSLSDADGAVQLVFSDMPVEITSTDIAALGAALADLQDQIDVATAEVAALTEAAASVNVNKLRNRIAANEDAVEALEKKTKGLNVENVKKRLNVLEKAVADLDKQSANLKKRVNALEKTDKDHEERIAALEEIVPTPEQPLP